MNDRRYQIECENSYEMVDVRKLIDDVMFQTVRGDGEINLQVAQLQSELERKRDESLTHRFRDSNQQEKPKAIADCLENVLPTPPNPQIPMSETVTRNQVFISCSHHDQEWLTKLQKHLKPMIRNQNQNLLVWDDTKIQAGAKWRQEIENALAVAKVAVLLVSPDFLASDFIADNELPPLLDAAEAQGLTIIWIPLSFSSYEETEIEKYQSAHAPNQPLDSLNSAQENKAWVDICKKIKAAAVPQ
ncbi:toll/interleukin-1 receptor domain-containing protein [Nostoc sp.]|uniref:toll/interleukin-1 receptor domain-containing protein n=2 Tax=Nostoc sp. TaxID=1180 RepID=UPI002FFBA526